MSESRWVSTSNSGRPGGEGLQQHPRASTCSNAGKPAGTPGRIALPSPATIPAANADRDGARRRARLRPRRAGDHRPSWARAARERRAPRSLDLPREHGRDGRGLDDRARRRIGAWLALVALRGRRRDRGAGGDRGGARTRTDRDPAAGSAAGRRSAASRLRPPVAAQGDPPRERLQGASRRGRDLRQRARRSADGSARRARRARLVRLHPLLQGRPPRRARGRLHRRHLREHPGLDPARRRGRRRRGRSRRHASASPFARRWHASPRTR